MQKQLKTHWEQALGCLASTNSSCLSFFEDLIKRYSEQNRYYHNIEHIATIIDLIISNKHKLKSAEVLILAAFYHDAVYNVRRTDNEAKSAKLALKQLSQLGITGNTLQRVNSLIINTKNHFADNIDNHDFDLCFFLDCDLFTLGAEREKYIRYIQNIRKEYKMYPDFMYKKGRLKILEIFLSHDKIFKTKLFSDQYEIIARDNISYEINYWMTKR